MRRRNQRALSLAANTFRWCTVMALVGCDVRVSLGTNEVINDASIDAIAPDATTDSLETIDGGNDTIAVADATSDNTLDPTSDAATDATGDADCVGCPWIRTLVGPTSDIRRFGRSLAGNDEYLAIGASSTSGPSGPEDSVFLYRVTDPNSLSLELVAQLRPNASDTSRLFGRSVALTDEYLLVGSGQQVYFYRLSTPTKATFIFAPSQISHTGFGYAVAAFDNEVRIGRYTETDIGSWIGTYYDRNRVLEYQPRGSEPTCREVSMAYNDEGLALSTCASVNDVVVSRFDDQLNGYQQIGVLDTPAPPNHETGAVASRQDFMVIGWRPTVSRGGAIQFFRVSPSWDSVTPGPILEGPQNDLNNSFGLDVTIVGGFVLASAPTALNSIGAEVGAVYVFPIPTIE